MHKFSILILLVVSIFIFSKTAEAKVLPQAKTGTKTAVKVVGTGINVTPKIRADRRAVVVYFSNLQNAKDVSYMLVYKSNGQEEGAMGGLNLKGSNTATQELLLGTCSKNVCRYHTNIKDARLEVSYTLKTGKKYLKKYRLKI